MFFFPFFLQVFVANPNKALPIQEILVKNKDKLVEFLTNFHNDRTGIFVTVNSLTVRVRLETVIRPYFKAQPKFS